MEGALAVARRETALALKALSGFGGEADFLRNTAEEMLSRIN